MVLREDKKTDESREPDNSGLHNLRCADFSLKFYMHVQAVLKSPIPSVMTLNRTERLADTDMYRRIILK